MIFIKKLLFKLSFVIIFLSLFFIPKSNSSEKFNFPTEYREISSSYGTRNIFGGTYFHNGIDFLAPESSKVYATSSGIVADIGFNTSFGNYIIIQHSNDYRSLYGHLGEKNIVSLGEYITSGMHIANVGPKYLSNGVLNGLTTGPHLHFTIYNEKGNTINPIELIKEDSKNTTF